VWQTYDYYFDVSAGYFGSKKASEPLHIQWNPLSDHGGSGELQRRQRAGLSAHAEVLDMSGARKWEKSATLDSNEDSVNRPIKIEFPSDLTPVHFIRLTLTRGSDPVSDNFYLHSLERESPRPQRPAPAAARWGYNLKAIRSLPKVKVEAATKIARQGSRWASQPSCEHIPASRP